MIRVTNTADRAYFVQYITKVGQRVTIPLNPGEWFDEEDYAREQIEKFGYGSRIRVDAIN